VEKSAEVWTDLYNQQKSWKILKFAVLSVSHFFAAVVSFKQIKSLFHWFTGQHKFCAQGFRADSD